MNAAEAEEKINALVNEAYKKIEEAETLANLHKIEFNFSLGYGMGGRYIPNKPKLTRAEALELIKNENELSVDMRYYVREVIENTYNDDDSWEESSCDYYDNSYGWRSSSSDC